MPIYEYTCTACGAAAEILQKLSDPPAKKCPACGKAKLTKQISAAGFRLSGGGWYETDFKKDGKKNLAGDKAEAAPAASADSKKSEGAEAKPDKAAKPDGATKPAKADKADKKGDKPGKKAAAKAA